MGTQHFLESGRNWEHVLAAMLLLARLGDVVSTRLATPTLQMEANAILRRFGWRFAWLTTALCLIAYVNTVLAMIGIVVSLFVTASNLSRAWIMRALGEVEYLRMLQRAAAASTRGVAIAFILASAGTTSLAGLLLLVMSDGPDTWPYWFAAGILTYAFAVAVHGCAFVGRLYRQAATSSPSGAAG